MLEQHMVSLGMETACTLCIPASPAALWGLTLLNSWGYGFHVCTGAEGLDHTIAVFTLKQFRALFGGWGCQVSPAFLCHQHHWWEFNFVEPLKVRTKFSCIPASSMCCCTINFADNCVQGPLFPPCSIQVVQLRTTSKRLGNRGLL